MNFCNCQDEKQPELWVCSDGGEFIVDVFALLQQQSSDVGNSTLLRVYHMQGFRK
jgi:hypothetical protein